MNTNFSNYSDLDKQTRGKAIYIELSNGYYIPVNKSQIKKVAKRMIENNDTFCGDILYYSPSLVKISIKNS